MADELSSATPTHICIDCVTARDNEEPVALNKDGYCSRCGSSSVVPLSTVADAFASHKREQAPPPDDEQWRERHKALLARRRESTLPLRNWLLKKFPRTTGLHALNMNRLNDAVNEWDGWAFHSYAPWDEDNPFPLYHTIELVQGVKNGPRWVISLSTDLIEVRSFQDGTVKQ